MRKHAWLLFLLAGLGCETNEIEETVDAALLESPNVHDPLSMPESPTLDPSSFDSATDCQFCHSKYVEEWSTSGHAYAMKDPVFQALVKQRQEDLEGTEDQFCTQCHSALGTRGGECVPGFNFEELSSIVMEGVTCVACHQVTGLERPFNSGHTLSSDAPMMGGIENPQKTAAHDSAADPLIQSAAFCGGCHDVVETNGLNLERPHEEWIESPLGGSSETCQSCHMPAEAGEAVDGGPERQIHSHRFRGVGIPMLEGFVPDAETMAILDGEVEELLSGSSNVEVSHPDVILAGEQLDLVVTIQNLIPGHNLPTGSNFLRQFWLDLIVTDSEGRVLYRTGDLDSNGDLRNVWSETDPFGDPDLITLTSDLLDAKGDPVLFPWDAVELVNRAIAPAHERTYTLFVPVPEDAATPLEVQASLLFRAFPPYLLRTLGLSDYVGKLKIRTLSSVVTSVDVE